MEPSSALQWVQRSVLLMALQTDSQLDQQTEQLVGDAEGAADGAA